MTIRKVKDVIVLGSGLSILDLTPEDVQYINSCEVVIAINKFIAFYKETGIYPTHVYYVDNYQPSVQRFLQFVFDVCRQDKLENLTFILGKRLRSRIASNNFYYYLKRFISGPKNIYRIIRYGKQKVFCNIFRVPKNCSFEFIEHEKFTVGGAWAQSLAEKLFHFRGSLSTVLNYISIKYPSRMIRLVGVDFNSSRYFFQDKLEELDFEWQDWTSELVAKEGRHFSAIPYVVVDGGRVSPEGTTIFDRFEFIVECLDQTGNKITSSNPDSLLVQKRLVDFVPLPGKSEVGLA